MSNPTAVLECTRSEEILVVALELSVKEWKLAAAPMSDPLRPRLAGVQARDVNGLLDEIVEKYPAARCYRAVRRVLDDRK